MEYLTLKYQIIVDHAVYQEGLRKAASEARQEEHQPGCSDRANHNNGCVHGPYEIWGEIWGAD